MYIHKLLKDFAWDKSLQTTNNKSKWAEIQLPKDKKTHTFEQLGQNPLQTTGEVSFSSKMVAWVNQHPPMHRLWMKLFWPFWDEPKPFNLNQTKHWGGFFLFFSLAHPSLRFQNNSHLLFPPLLSSSLFCFFFLTLLFHCCYSLFFHHFFSFFLLVFFFLLFCLCYRFFFLSFFSFISSSLFSFFFPSFVSFFSSIVTIFLSFFFQYSFSLFKHFLFFSSHCCACCHFLLHHH